MRVIAGVAGGLRLEVPKQGVRPTMDRVKAAIFSSLAAQVIDARVLDLFAGSGGLGIEALSRGARSAVFVESSRVAAQVIRRNLALANLPGDVLIRDAIEFLKHSASEFEIIFADPPYDRADEHFSASLLRNIHLPRLLAEAGVFVLEKRPEEKLPPHPAWNLARARKYGATEVLFFSGARR